MRVDIATIASRKSAHKSLCTVDEMAFEGGSKPPGSASSPNAAAQVPGAIPDFFVVNRSQKVVTSVHVMTSAANGWGSDKLPGTLSPGERFEVKLPRNGQCVYDVRVTYADKSTEEKHKQNVCSLDELAFGSGAPPPQVSTRPTAPPKTAAPTQTGIPDFFVVNRSQKVIGSLYVSSAAVSSWGADLLPGTLNPGGRFEVKLPRNGQCVYDVRVVYQDQSSDERQKQNVCALNELVFSGEGRPAPRGGQGGEQATGFGTGFFVSASGHALTNNHVVNGCERIASVIEGQMVPSIVVRVDKQNDLALIRAQMPGTVRFAKFRASPGIRVGEDVVVAGFPLQSVLQNGLNVTRGNVSAMGGIGGNTAEMQMTAPVQPGNSGGPLFDMSGNVVGVVVSRLNSQAVKTETQNINYAVQGAIARLFLESNGVRAVEEPSTRDIKVGDLSDGARDFTFQIACFRKR